MNLNINEDGELDYFDLYAKNGGVVCMDGEICTVVSQDGNIVLLQNESDGLRFKLTPEEFNCATSHVTNGGMCVK